MTFDTEDFMKFLFSSLFLFVCCLFIMLYTNRILGIIVQLFLRYCILPSAKHVRLGAIFIAPLSCRIFIQNFFYQDENMSLRVMDGYVTFYFWDSWLKDPSWTTVKDFMFTENLKGMRCRVMYKMKWVHGVIVRLDKEKQKVWVRLDGSDAGAEENSSFVDVDDEIHSIDVPLTEVPMPSGNVIPSRVNASELNSSKKNLKTNNASVPPWVDVREHSQRSPSETAMNMPFSPADNEDAHNEHNEEEEGDEHENTKRGRSAPGRLFDIDAVQIPQKRGKIRIHLNGMGLCLYNATWNYKIMASTQPNSTDVGGERRKPSLSGWALRSIISRLAQEGEGVQENAEEEMSRFSADSLNDNNGFNAETRGKALEEQHRRKNTKSATQHLFDFIGAVEVELYASYIDVGGAGASHPYFLHIGFKRAECHNYLTMDGVPSIDLYRFLSEMSLEEVHARWSPMKKEKENMNDVTHQEISKTWRDSFMLMMKGSSSNDGPTPAAIDESSSLIRNYGMLLNGKEKSTIHIVFYRDVTNVYAGEDVTRETELPHMGFELFIDAPELSYGPWSHYSLMKLKEFFFPITYQPLEALKFELGKPRPLAGFEVFVEFLRDTYVTVPFKRKNPAPSPPFGICDSGCKGVVLMMLGRGSQYVQKPQYLLNNEKKQWFESLLSGKNVTLATNGIQDESTVLAQMKTLELFIDREDDRAYTGRKLWNVLPTLGEVELWWYMDYIPFFMDLLTDWQFVPQMYHGEPLTTEIYNTLENITKEFIPNVKRFEVFFTVSAVLHLNCNPQNVIFSEDLNDESFNCFLNFRIKSPSHLFMTLPSDAYFLSASTEVQRPLEMSLQNMDVSLSLPHTHPLYKLVDATVPFAQVDDVTLKGSQTVYIPNQTVPQDKAPVDPVTGRTKLLNQLELDLQLTGVRGFVMAPHIRAFIDMLANLFDDSDCVVRPDELFWPLSKIQPKLGAPKNVRQKFNDYLQKDEPRSNIQEITLNLTILDIDVTLRGGGVNSPKLNLCAGKFMFSLLKQCAVDDMSITVTPITSRFYRDDGGADKLVDGSFLCCGDIAIGMVYHYGPMPMRTCFHGATNAVINGITFDMTVEQVAMLTQLFDAFTKQFSLRDAMLLEKIEFARTQAAYSADQLMPRSVCPLRKSSKELNVNSKSLPFRCIQSGVFASRPGSIKPDGPMGDARCALQRFLSCDGTNVQLPFSESVPEVMAVSFYKYLEALEKAADEGKDHAVVTMLASLEGVSGCVRVGTKGYLELQLPCGVQMASSTLNDLNSNSRMSVVAREIVVRGLYSQEAHEDSKSCDDFVEVFHVKTSLCMRNYTAYPFHEGLEYHLEAQRRFVAENDVDHLFTCRFPSTPQMPTQSKDTAQRQTTVRAPLPVPVVVNTEEEAGNLEEMCMQTSTRQETNCFQPIHFGGQEQDSNLQMVGSSRLGSLLDVSRPRSSRDDEEKSDSSNNNNNNTIITSKQYVTCLSATNDKEMVEEEEDEERTFGVSNESVINDAFAAVNASDDVEFISQLAKEVKMEDTLTLHPSESFTTFLRPFFRHSQADDELTSLQYGAGRHAKGCFRDFTCFHAPLPSTTFFAAMSPHRAPNFFMAQQMLSSTMSDKGNDEESEVWALRQADNRKRSREGLTSKHLHIEAIGPLIVLVTKVFVEHLYFDAEVRFFRTVHYYQTFANAPAARNFLLPGSLNPLELNVAQGSRCPSKSPMPHKQQQQRGIHRKEPSKSRAHQKRWQVEVKITSVILPCVEVKVLVDFPVPQENMAPGASGTGVYTTMLGARAFHFVMQRTLPPARATMQTDTKALSASARVSSLAFITQIEYEPVVRNGNLQIKVPGITYDMEKDTLAVSYLTSVCGRGKHENSHGMGDGRCHVTVDTVAIHLTRDFLFFLHSAKAMILQLLCHRETRQKEINSIFVELGGAVDHHGHTESVRDMIFPRESESSDAPFASLDDFGIEASANIQGVGTISTIRMELVDVYQKGRYIYVNTESANLFEVKESSAKFIAKVPIKRKGEGSKTFMGEVGTLFVLGQSMNSPSFFGFGRPRRPVRRDAEVQFLGEVSSVLIRCYPSVIRIVDAVKKKNGMREDEHKELNYSRARMMGDFAPPSDAGISNSGQSIVFKGTFTLRNLDVVMLHSKLNFMQFKVVNLTGCGASQTERISSRECVQTHVFTHIISQRIRERLRVLAQRARERAHRSRHAAPPSVTPQLLLKTTASFFAESIFLQYVADVIVPETSGAAVATVEGSRDTTQEHEESRVFMVSATHLAVGMHLADQNQILALEGNPKSAAKKKSDGAPGGVQINMQIDIGKVNISLPYRLHAAVIIEPQLHQWLQVWIEAKKIVQPMRSANTTKVDESCLSLSVTQPKKIHAFCWTIHLHETRVKLSLPQGISAELKIPLASGFLNISSDERLNLKAHLHPFAFLSDSPSAGRHAVEFPSVYLICAKDERMRLGTCLMEFVEVTVSPIIISHLLLVSERLIGTYISITKPFRVGREETDEEQQIPQDQMKEQEQQHQGVSSFSVPALSAWKGRFVFFLEGLRVSYLTSMTNLRFSLNKMNALTEMTSSGKYQITNLTVNVAKAQIALVDRDDYDKMQSALRQPVGIPQSDASSPSTKAAMFPRQSVSLASEDSVRVVRLSGGFVWGLFETSFTLTSGRRNINEMREAIENIFATTRGSLVDLSEIGKLGSTATHWNLSIVSLLVVLRVGLVPLLQQSFAETQELAEKMRFESQREGRLFRRQIFKHGTYRQLARVQKQMDAQVERSQQQKIKRLHELAAQIKPENNRPTFQRRPSALQSPKLTRKTDENEDLFNAKSDSKFFATVSNFLIVMPFGDAAFRGILEGKQDMYPPGRGVSRLSGRDFIPNMALKLRVEKSTFVCRFLKSQRWPPLICSTGENNTNTNNDLGTFLGIAEKDTPSNLSFTSRCVVEDVNLYFTDGSPLDNDVSVKELLSRTHILGGLGTLTSFGTSEHKNSFSKIYVGSIDAPIHVTKADSRVNIGAIIDMSSPKICISTRFVSILSQIMQEIPTVTLYDLLRSNGVSKTTNDGPNPSPQRSQIGETATAPEETPVKEHHVDPLRPRDVTAAAAAGAAASPYSKRPLSYHFDITARLEEGEIKIFCVQKDIAAGVPSTPQPGVDSLLSKLSRPLRRRVKFTSDKPDPNNTSSATAAAGDPFASAYPMTELLSFPTPDITAMFLGMFDGSKIEEDELIVRVEMRASTIEVGPSILTLAVEIEEWVTIQNRERSERVSMLLNMVRGWERDITNSELALYCSISDVALPVPQALVEAWTQARASSNGLGALRRQQKERKHLSDTSSVLRSHPSTVSTINRGGQKNKTFMSIHFRITGLRFVLTTEPASTVTMSLFLDERGGSLDFFIKRISGEPPKSVYDSATFVPPTISFFLCVRRARLECQARLEVKSLEMHLPEVVACSAVRRCKHAWELTNVYVHTPLNVSDGLDMEIIVRAPHVAQIFTVQELWHKTLLELMHSIQQLLTRSGDIIRENVKKNPTIQRRLNAMRTGRVNETLMITVAASHVKLRLDLSPGNAQESTLGGVNLFVMRSRSPNRVHSKTCFDVSIRSFLLRSEGVLSGMANLESLFIKGFVIGNAEGSTTVLRSPSGHTFREALCMQKMHVMFKERQLKDVFECQVIEFCMGLMDGIDEKDDDTEMKANVSLFKSSVFITPSTVSVFLNTVRSFSEIMAAQRETAMVKLRDTGMQPVRPLVAQRGSDDFHDAAWVLKKKKAIFSGQVSVPLLGDDNVGSNGRSNNSSNTDVKKSEKEVKDLTITDAGSITPSVDKDEMEGAAAIPFMGNFLTRIPCGEITVKLQQTTLLLGGTSTGTNSSGGLIASFPSATVSFAECPSDNHTVVRKVLEINTENMELYRPGAIKVLILGFRGSNKFEFYSRQKIGDSEVGFTLTLFQTIPWTGNPRFQDFQEMIQLVRSFTMKGNVEVFQHFGKIDAKWPMDASQSTKTPKNSVNSDNNTSPPSPSAAAPTSTIPDTTIPTIVEEAALHSPVKQEADERRLKALQHVKFSPQLRFGGDVAVNTDVILNWLGISEKMLPQILHMQACDRLEHLLNRLHEGSKGHLRKKEDKKKK